MVSKKAFSVSETSAVNLIVGWCLFACSTNCVISPQFVFQEGEYVVYVAFPNERFDCALAHDFCFNSAHENIGKGDCHLCPHGGSMCLEIILSIKLE